MKRFRFLHRLAAGLVCTAAVISSAAAEEPKAADAGGTNVTESVSADSAAPALGQKGPGKKGVRKGSPGKAGSGNAGRMGQNRPSPIIRMLDTDQNGELSGAEIDNASTALRSLDTNSDGVLNASELSAVAAGRGSGGKGGQSPDFITRLMNRDTNKDGKLSQAELPEKMAGMMTRADKNGDASLDAEELKAIAADRAARGEKGPGEKRRQGKGKGPGKSPENS